MSGLPDVSALPGPNADLWDWQLGARCREVSTTVFFHPWGERGDRRRQREVVAKEICASCPVIDQCARHALTAREQYGVWGGMGEDERRAMLRGTGPRGRRPSEELTGASTGSPGGFGSDSV